jgi:hypothetical protein
MTTHSCKLPRGSAWWGNEESSKNRCVCVCVCVCVCACVYVCWVCACMYSHLAIQTHTHSHSPFQKATIERQKSRAIPFKGHPAEVVRECMKQRGLRIPFDTSNTSHKARIHELPRTTRQRFVDQLYAVYTRIHTDLTLAHCTEILFIEHALSEKAGSDVGVYQNLCKAAVKKVMQRSQLDHRPQLQGDL